MLLVNLPAIQVVLPLMAAPLCFVIRQGKVAWAFTLAVMVATLGVAVMLFQQVREGNREIRYAMGNWIPPVGIEYRVDILNAVFLLLVCIVGCITLAFSYKSTEHEIAHSRHPAFYALFLLCVAGLLGIVITNDAFNIYVFLEIASLAMYGMIAMGRDRRALIASFEYLVLGTIGATFILIAIGLLYMMTGTLNITDLSQRVQQVSDATPIRAAFAFFTIGLALKIALFPLHIWLANGYTNAPSFVSSFLAAVGTKVSLYVLVRVLFSLFGKPFSFEVMPLPFILIMMGILGVMAGSIMGIFQQNVKRLLAYSSVAQLGYITISLGLASKSGLTAAFIHMINHAFAKGALFMAVGCIAFRTGGVRLTHFKGVGRLMPYSMAAFVTAGLSLIGIPLTAGFISKYYMVMAAFEKQHWIILATILTGSFLSIVYIWKVIEVAYFQRPQCDTIREAPLMMVIPLWVMTLLSLVTGIYTTYTAMVASDIADYVWNIGGGV